jgi:hypothetical protein
MFEFGFSKKLFYVASFVQVDDSNPESGLSVIILGIRVTWLDKPINWRRREWVFPRSAWRGHVEG